MKKSNFIQLALFFTLISISTSAMATDFFSLKAGAWENTTDVWSTDGINPCACNPGHNLLDVNLTINHKLEPVSDITVGSGTLLTLIAGEIEGGIIFAVSGGIVNNLTGSSIEVNQINVNNGGELNSEYSSLEAQFNIQNDAIMNHSGEVYLKVGGSYTTSIGGITSLAANTVVTQYTGVAEVAGIMDFGGSACFKSMTGSLTVSTGAVSGTGAVSVARSIINLGSWSLNVDWCAGAIGENLPKAENCKNVCDGTFPVEYSYFNAAQKADYTVKIEWKTNQELNNDRFEIQRSVENGVFETIGKVVGKGTTEQASSYSFIDQNPASGPLFYRLVQVDLDGTQNVSNILTVEIAEASLREFSVYPNPFQGQLNLAYLSSSIEPVDIQIYSITGALVHQQQNGSSTGSQQIQLNLSILPAGAYIVKVQDSQVSKTFKVIQQ